MWCRYNVVAESADAKGVAPPTAWDAETLEAWLARLAASVNGDHAVETTRDVFDQGFDRRVPCSCAALGTY